MILLNRNAKLVREFERLMSSFEDESLYFKPSQKYFQDKERILNKRGLKARQLEQFFKEYAEDRYTKVIRGQDYKTFHNNYYDKSEVESSVKYGRYLYIAFNQINKNTIDKVIKAIDNNRQYRYLILDLRNNIGGNVEECARLLRMFVLSDNLFSLDYKFKTIEYRADKARYQFENIFIWVSENTISSGELLALSLRTNVEGTYILGNGTGKKEVGQTIIVNKELKFILSYTTFRWRVGSDESKSMDYFLKKDNIKQYNSIDDFYKAIISLNNFEGDEGN